MKTTLLSFFVLLFCTSIIAQNSVNLKLNLEKNKVYRFNSVSEQTVTQTINGNSQTSDSKINNTISIKMIDATADFMITEVRFDSLITSSNAMGKISRISSVSEGNIKSTEIADVMSCFMNRLSKNALYIKMDFTGKVLEVVNAKMLSDVIMKDTSSIVLKGQLASAVKSQLQNLINEKTLKTMVEVFTYNLPGKDVSPGNDWNVTLNTSTGGMALDITTNYHLDGVNGNVANITAESDIKAAANADPIVAGGAKITYDDIKGLGKSTITIDTRTGLLIEDTTRSHTAGNLGINAPGMSMQMPMDISGESKIIAL
jgi:hypothetical protein